MSCPQTGQEKLKSSPIEFDASRSFFAISLSSWGEAETSFARSALDNFPFPAKLFRFNNLHWSLLVPCRRWLGCHGRLRYRWSLYSSPFLLTLPNLLFYLFPVCAKIRAKIKNYFLIIIRVLRDKGKGLHLAFPYALLPALLFNDLCIGLESG
jgi:hypothetical protein